MTFSERPSFLSFSGFLKTIVLDVQEALHTVTHMKKNAFHSKESNGSCICRHKRVHLQMHNLMKLKPWKTKLHKRLSCVFQCLLTAFNCSSCRFSRPSLFKAASSFLIDFNTCFRRARRTGFGSQGLISQT